MLTELDDSSPPSQHWSWKKITLWISSVLIAFLVAIFAYDEELKPYDDLLPTHAEVPDAKTNGYLFLRERWENLPAPADFPISAQSDLISGKLAWDEPRVAKMRVGRETCAEDLKTALLLPVYLTPPVLVINDPELERVTWINQPFRYLALEVTASAQSGDMDAALAQLSGLHSLSVRQVKGSGSLMALLMGISMHSLTATISVRLLESGKLDAIQLAALADMWKGGLPAAQSWQEAMRSEAAYSRDVILAVVEKRPDLNESIRPKNAWLLLKKNKTLNRMSQRIRHASNVAFQTFSSKSEADAAGWGEVKDTRSKLKRTLNANYAGNKLTEGEDSLGLLIPGMTNKLLFEPRAMRVAIAIHRWKATRPGQWPATLKELVPEFLSSVPNDPFNGNPLLWDPAGQIISSVGSDWKANAPKFNGPYPWFGMDHDSPALRLTRPPAQPLPPLPPRPRKASAPPAASRAEPAPAPAPPQ